MSEQRLAAPLLSPDTAGDVHRPTLRSPHTLRSASAQVNPLSHCPNSPILVYKVLVYMAYR